MTAKNTASVFILLLLGVSFTVAQPSPEELADRMDQVFQEQLSGINEIEFSYDFVSGILSGFSETVKLVKVEEDGKLFLKAAEDEYGDDMGSIIGVVDQMYGEIVRHARSVTYETFHGMEAYKVVIDDMEAIEKLDAMSDFFDAEDEEDVDFEEFTLYIDRDELVLLYAEFNSGEDELELHIRFLEYESYSGYPVPMVIELDIIGLDRLISEEEMAEAQAMMDMIRGELDDMDDGQREMIEAMIGMSL
ncbi:hypothetical protein QLX67_04995, partial [Balneolaceae bacterium ANBcel3]|nr:hypothetical protein [Balneolaceae bacterium ANBcel3]